MSVIVSDTSPLSALIRLGRLSLLPELYGSLVIAPTVYAELLNLSALGYELDFLSKVSWLTIVAPRDHQLLSDLSQELDMGEAEALVLARELDASLLIIDEKKGRKIAQEMQLPHIGLLGVLLEAKEKELIPEIRPLLEALREIGFRIAPALFDRVLRQAGE